MTSPRELRTMDKRHDGNKFLGEEEMKPRTTVDGSCTAEVTFLELVNTVPSREMCAFRPPLIRRGGFCTIDNRSSSNTKVSVITVQPCYRLVPICQT
jgi:hypothetical protein